MKVVQISSLEGTEFPAGRRTRVIVGQNGAVTAMNFSQGFVEIHQGGRIPLHSHDMEESYTILSGSGKMTVGAETLAVGKGDLVLIDPNLPHELVNTGDEELQMMFVYSPASVADHWKQELSGEL